MQLRLGARLLDLSRPKVMGVLNVTPDSFSDGGEFLDHDAALVRAAEMVAEGAAIIDVGGESTRPGAPEVGEEEEIDRVVPVIESIRRRHDVFISVDTSKAAVMRAAVAAGAAMINDVYALRLGAAMEVAARTDAAVCLMHMLGTPGTMQHDPAYDDVVGEVCEFLSDRLDACREAGFAPQRLCVDPGFGFGKTDRHNLELLANLERFRVLGAPLLVGLSRKRTLGKLTGREVSDRAAAGLAAAVLAVERGASIVRTHDVAATVDALEVATALIGVMDDE